MDATTLIQQHLDVEALLEHYGFNSIRNDGDIIRACCKLHGGDNPTAFVINKNTGLWYCHTGECGGGDVFTLVQKFEGISFKESVHWLSNFFNVNIDNLQIIERKAKYIKDINNFINLMKSKKKKEVKEFHIKEKVQEVIKFRGFKEETLKHFKLGYVQSITLKKRNGEEYTLKNRLVFPIIFDNTQVGVSLRRVRNSDFPKWSHQPVSLKTKEILYNYDNAKSSKEIIVCEGITDVWAFYEIGLNAVATFGAHITDEQYKLLLKTGADLIFAFDGDDAGKIATEKAIKMFKNKANLSVIKFSDGEDAESISRKELRERYESKRRV